MSTRSPPRIAALEGLYGGIDLHSNNNVVAIMDAQGKKVFGRRLVNDLAGIEQCFAVYTCATIHRPTRAATPTRTARIVLSIRPPFQARHTTSCGSQGARTAVPALSLRQMRFSVRSDCDRYYRPTTLAAPGPADLEVSERRVRPRFFPCEMPIEGAGGNGDAETLVHQGE